MKILIVEDRLETIYGILDFCEDNGYAKEVIDNFELAVPKLKTDEYDLLILDLKKDPTEDYPGFEIFNKVWEECFLPVIVFSSYLLNMPEIIDHPFIKYFEKDKEEDVKTAIKEFELKNDNIRKLKKTINELFIFGLRAYKKNEEHSILMQRIMLHMGNWLENYMNQDLLLPADIMLIDLPHYSGFITCDIIEEIPIVGSSEESKKYMIFSPWCEICGDLNVNMECRKLININKLPERARQKLENNKNNGGCESYILLPNNSKFKDLVVNCKSIELIKKKDISLFSDEQDVSRFKYRKIFTIPSPYRERMIKICYDNRSRIGVPNIDENSWWGE